MRQVTDDLGRTVTVPAKITRVVSTAPSITEMVFASGAGDKLVGVTTFCNYPEEAKSIAKIGDTMTPNMETIVALKPDVVIVSTDSQLQNFAGVLEDNNISIFVTNTARVEHVIHDVKQLGELLGTQKFAEASASELFTRYESVVEKTKAATRLAVFVQISKDPLFTIGKDSFITNLIYAGGGASLTDHISSGYPKLSKETASAMQPDVIILSDSPDNQEPNEAFRSSPAVKNGRVYKVNADLLSRPGPRLVDALEQIARHLHPEKFE
jgi:iron complex transport system substrate-binding protein